MRRFGAFSAIILAAGLAVQVQAVQVVTNIDGNLGVAENTCVSPISNFVAVNCTFSGGPTRNVEAGQPSLGPLESGGFYADVASSPGFALSTEPGVDDNGVSLDTFLVSVGSLPGDGKAALLLTGTITIDDGDDGFGDTTDTIAGTLEIGAGVRYASTGSSLAGSKAVEEEWTRITHTLPATLVSSAAANGAGGYDYVLGADGFPPDLCTGTGGTPAGIGDCFASEVAAVDGATGEVSHSPWLVANGGTGFNFVSGVGGTDILSYGIPIPTLAPEPNPGGTTTAVITGYNCIDTGIEPKEVGVDQDTLTDCQDSSIAWDLIASSGAGAGKRNAGFDNLVMLLSTNGNGEVIAANAYYTMEYDIFSDPVDDSWVGGTLSFAMANPIPTAVDDPPDPVNNPIIAGVNSPTPIRIDVLANDTGLDDTPLTITVDTPPSFGTAIEDPGDGTPATIRIDYTYTAQAVNATDSFTYFITDGTPDTSVSAEVIVEINNKQPIAVPDDVAVVEGQSITIDVLNNDDLGDTPSEAVAVVRDPIIGTAVVSGLQIDYTSTAGTGPDTFRYSLEDYNGDTSEAEVSVTVIPAGQILAVDDFAGTNAGQSVPVQPLSNDAGLSVDPFMVTITMDPSKGSVTTISPCAVETGCTVTYTPDPGRAGVDTFEYEARDSSAAMPDTATVTITINDRPVALADVAETPLGGAVTIDVLDNDGGLSETPLTVNIESGPSFGTADPVDSGGGTPDSIRVEYVNEELTRTDTFTYTITDDTDDVSNIATVTITVDDSPEANPDFAEVEPNNSVEMPVLQNDSGLNDTPLVVDIMDPSVTQAGCNDQATCIVTYTSGAATGADTFDYTVIDDDGDSASTTVTVTVADPSIPVAVDDFAQTSRNQDVIIDVLENDGGLIDVPITVLINPEVHRARNGRLTVNGSPGKPQDISITYSPGLSFFGNDSFIYEVTDDGGQSSQATVQITVVDDQPIITLPSDDSSAVSPFSLALLSMLIWLRRRKRA